MGQSSTMKRCRRSAQLLLACLAIFLCEWRASAQQRLILVGSGSTVPSPLYASWADAYNAHSRKIQMRYLAMGTSEGLKQLEHGVTDFGAGEALPSSAEMQSTKLVLLPTVLVGIVPIHNVPGVSKRLQFSGEVLADIYLGEIRRWNDPKIARLNPGVSLPDIPVRVVYRPAGKGSNFIFSDFLSKTSPQFRSRIGRSASPKWPVGEPAERSSDMADKIRQTSGAIGYIESNYAVKERIAYAAVRNAAGDFVAASPETLTTACAAMWHSGASDMAISLTDAPGKDSYPITSFTWLYLRAHDVDPARSAAMQDLLKWALNEGQQLAMREGYTPLPRSVLSAAKDKLSSISN